MSSQQCETTHFCMIKSEIVKHTFNIFFFSTFYFGDTNRLMYKKSNLFVYVFVVNCPFFQVTPARYVP